MRRLTWDDAIGATDCLAGSGWFHGLDFAGDPGGFQGLGDVEFVTPLQIDPEGSGSVEIAAEAQGRVGGWLILSRPL